jgi:hypothetical protein
VSRTFTISPVVLDNIPVSDTLAVGFDLAPVMSSVTDAAEMPRFYRTGLHAEASLLALVAPVSGALRLRHTTLPTYGGRVVVDDRATAELELAMPLAGARAEAFAGRALVVDSGGSERVTIFGGAVEGAWAVHPVLDLIARFESARLLAPGFDAEPVTTRWDVRATLAVAAHYDRAW